MADVGSVKYKVELDNSGLDKDTQNTEKTISSKLDAISGKISRSFGYQVLKDIGGAFLNLGKQAVQGFTEISMAALESTASLEQNVGGVETLFKSSADTVIANAKRAYSTAGMSANEYMETVTSVSASLLQSLGGDTEKAASAADQAIIDMSDNANKMGTSLESIKTAYAGFAKGQYMLLDNLKLGYGGTKGEMERLLQDAQKLTGVKYDINNLSDVYSAIHAIQENLGITGTTAEEAATTIEGSMLSAKAAYDNFLNGTITGEEFAETLAVAAENVAENLAVIIQNFADQLPGIVEVVSARLPELLTTLGPPILDALGAIAKSALIVGADLAMSIAQGVKDHGPEILAKAGEILEGFLGAITEKLPDIQAKGLEMAGNIASGILQKAPDVITAIGGILTNLLGKLLEAAPRMMENGVNLIANMAQGLLNNLPAVLEAIGQVLVDLLAKIAEHGPDILQKGIELIGKLAAGLVDAIPDAVKGMTEVLGKIKDAVGEIDWAQLGGNIISGIISGLRNAGSNLFTSMKNLAGEALRAAKSKLESNSPSKAAARELGEPIPEGMAVGIERKAGLVADAMADVAGGALASPELPDMKRIGADIGATISAATSTEISVPVVLDGREIARATAWYTNEQLAWEAR